MPRRFSTFEGGKPNNTPNQENNTPNQKYKKAMRSLGYGVPGKAPNAKRLAGVLSSPRVPLRREKTNK